MAAILAYRNKTPKSLIVFSNEILNVLYFQGIYMFSKFTCIPYTCNGENRKMTIPRTVNRMLVCPVSNRIKHNKYETFGVDLPIEQERLPK